MREADEIAHGSAVATGGRGSEIKQAAVATGGRGSEIELVNTAMLGGGPFDFRIASRGPHVREADEIAQGSAVATGGRGSEIKQAQLRREGAVSRSSS